MIWVIFAEKRRKSSIYFFILPFRWYNIPLIVHKLKICAKIATKIFLGFLEPKLYHFEASRVLFSGSSPSVCIRWAVARVECQSNFRFWLCSALSWLCPDNQHWNCGNCAALSRLTALFATAQSFIFPVISGKSGMVQYMHEFSAD